MPFPAAPSVAITLAIELNRGHDGPQPSLWPQPRTPSASERESCTAAEEHG